MTAALARFDQERRRRHGARLVGGIDEAGRGALAGPVVAACVVLAPGADLPGVDDSKVLKPEAREALVPLILERAAAWSLGWASAAEVDRHNVLAATLRAARRALAALPSPPDYLLTDYLKIEGAPCPYEAIVDGDAKSQAIAAASILAKVARDRIMTTLARAYPQYGFESHKGYGTPAHWAALEAHGPSTLHRLSFRGVTFFDSEPPVRANCRRSVPFIPCASYGHSSCACLTPEWLPILTRHPSALDPVDYLPEGE
jgi:ribonuclease HII